MLYIYEFTGLNGRSVIAYMLLTISKQTITQEARTNRRGGVEVELSPRVREIVVRSPVATDLSHKRGSDSSTAKHSAIGECHRSSEMTIINGCHVSQ